LEVFFLEQTSHPGIDTAAQTLSEDLRAVQAVVEELGFDNSAVFSTADLVARPEVRDMCAADKCRSYDANWSCPPACGSIEEFQELYRHYTQGLIFQTIVQMEDSFDYESIKEGSKRHKQRFAALIDEVSRRRMDVALLGAGSCNLCPQCSYPDSPCRQPERMRPSMEATGLVVNEVCVAAGIPYNYGADTLAYSSCALTN
jgi:predicted metal-binding protein